MVSNSQFYTACRKGRYAAFKKRIPLLICLFGLVSGVAWAQSHIHTYQSWANDATGYSLSLSADGSIVALGAPGADATGTDSGSARVFRNTNGSWTSLGSIFGDAVGDNLGFSVSLSADGTILAIGAPENVDGYIGFGYVRVYQYNNGSNTWTQLGADMAGAQSGGRFGEAISLSADGTILAVGASQNNASGTNAGAVRIYHWNGSSWSQRGSALTGASGERLGFSVSLSADGTRVAMGGSLELSLSSSFVNGVVRVYEWNGSTWAQLGTDFTGGTNENLGHSVSLNTDGTRLAIGVPKAAGGGIVRGRVEVYSYNGTSWSLLGSAINGEADNETLGISLSLDAGGNTLAIGMPTLSTSTPNSRIRLYRYNGSIWEKKPNQDIDVVASNSNPGVRSVSLSSDGSMVATGNPNFGSGGYVRILTSGASKVWLGSLGTDWTDASNWTGNSTPSASDDVLIPKVANCPTATSAVTVNSVTLNPGASLIAKAGLTGTVTYNRYLGTNNWYLVSAPVSGETLNDIIATNILATGTGTDIGWASYDNTTGGVSGGWVYQTSPLSGTVNLGTGQGYSVRLTAPNILPFTGTFPASGSGVTIALTNNLSLGGSTFNLVGNPYPSYIAVNNSANATHNILKLNGVDNSYLLEATIWLWNQATSSYDAFNQATGALHIAPGQGFFVRSVAGGTSAFSITENMQSHQAGDTFQRSSTNTNPKIELTLSDQNRQKKTHIYYIEGTTTGFDNGYDSTVFGAGDSFSIYTRLVGDDSQSEDMAIQSLLPNNYENTVVPIGLNAASGTQIHISAATANLPEGITVYLEDADNNTFTLLDQTSAFSTTLTADSSGTGRFYLHTSSQTLGQDDPVLNDISIYAVEGQLRIVGLDGGDAHLRLYGMLGQRVLDTRFRATGSDAIALPRLGSGLYLVELLSETGRIRKKLILR